MLNNGCGVCVLTDNDQVFMKAGNIVLSSRLPMMKIDINVDDLRLVES